MKSSCRGFAENRLTCPRGVCFGPTSKEVAAQKGQVTETDRVAYGRRESPLGAIGEEAIYQLWVSANGSGTREISDRIGV